MKSAREIPPLGTKHSLPRVFGENVRRIRRARDLTQEQLADLAGCHRTQIGYIERSGRNVGLIQVQNMAAALNVLPADLLRVFADVD